MNVLDQLEYDGIIPVVSPAVGADAQRLANAVLAGGLGCVEVAMDGIGSVSTIRELAHRGDLVVGAGWIRTVEEAQSAVDAGAGYLACPGFNAKLVTFCQHLSIPIFPGISSPTELHLAHDAGLTTVKFFPAEAMGGLNTLSAIGAAYPEMTFIPVGGIRPTNAKTYLENPQVIACIAAWITAPSLYVDGDYSRVTTAAREAVRSIAKWESCPHSIHSDSPLLIQYRAKPMAKPVGRATVVPAASLLSNVTSDVSV